MSWSDPDLIIGKIVQWIPHKPCSDPRRTAIDFRSDPKILGVHGNVSALPERATVVIHITPVRNALAIMTAVSLCFSLYFWPTGLCRQQGLHWRTQHWVCGGQALFHPGGQPICRPHRRGVESHLHTSRHGKQQAARYSPGQGRGRENIPRRQNRHHKNSVDTRDVLCEPMQQERSVSCRQDQFPTEILLSCSRHASLLFSPVPLRRVERHIPEK